MIQKIRMRLPKTEVSRPDLSPLANRLLANRGLSVPASELALGDIIPPDTMKDIVKGAEIVLDSLQKRERILVVGDYDVDGATATTLIVDCLRKYYKSDTHYFIPNRFIHGYGLSKEIIDDLDPDPKGRPHLIITVDNGISSIEGVKAAKAMGIKVVVTDHHLAGEELCPADAVIDPNQPDCSFPSKAACGCTVAFYLMWVLKRIAKDWVEKENLPECDMREYLDIVALATIADMVPLDHNNRILVHHGVERIRRGLGRPGINAIFGLTQKPIEKIQDQDFGFVIGPRLNAAGRMEDMTLGVECLLSQTDQMATDIALELETHNNLRKTVQAEMVESASQQIESLQESVNALDGQHDPSMVVWDTTWHEGIVGLVAGRLKERWFKPTIAMCPGHEVEGRLTYKGSARSIPGVHIRDIMAWVDSQYPGIMVKFGGHAMAAGLTVYADRLDDFKSAMNEAILKTVDPEVLIPEIVYDAELTDGDMTLSRIHEINRLGPWGQGCPKPVFLNDFTVKGYRWLGDKHLKLNMTLKNSDVIYDAIWFFCSLPVQSEPPETIRCAYELSINDFRGESVQIMVRDFIKPT